jgi:hypothetical protein
LLLAEEAEVNAEVVEAELADIELDLFKLTLEETPL